MQKHFSMGLAWSLLGACLGLADGLVGVHLGLAWGLIGTCLGFAWALLRACMGIARLWACMGIWGNGVQRARLTWECWGGTRPQST